MLTVISPAKSLDFSATSVAPTVPVFQDDAVRLARTMRGQTLTGLRQMMQISDDLARLNRDRFRAFAADPQPEAVKPAALAFAGDTYQGLQAASLTADDMAYAEDHLRILSGLYGLLRPLDGIQPYRLEMGSRLKTRRGETLYAYWGDRLAKALNRLGEAQDSDLLLNCASQEYFGACDRKVLKLQVITPQFLEVKDNRPRMVSFFAKRARGAMAAFVIRHRIGDARGVQAFDRDGYSFDANLSTPENPVFTRPYPDPA